MATLILAAIALGCLAIGVRLFNVEAYETWMAWIMRGSVALVVGLAGLFAYFLWALSVRPSPSRKTWSACRFRSTP